MKVCFITPYPPAGGGLGYYTKRLVKYLRRMKVDVSLILNRYVHFSSEKIQYTCLGIANLGSTLNFLKKVAPDIIHIQYTIPSYLLTVFHLWVILALHSKILKIPIFITLHDISTEINRFGYLGIFYYKLMSYFIDKFLVHTNEAKKYLIYRCKISSKKVSYMPHGFYEVDRNNVYLNKLKSEWHLEGKKIILFFGFIRPSKGIETLIEAIKIIKEMKKIENYIVLIVGDVRKRNGILGKLFQKRDEKYYGYLMTLVKKHSLEDIIKFKKMFLPEHMVFSLFTLCDVVVLPYNCAEESGVLNIALAIPKPIIATAVGGIKELLQEVGIIVPPKSPNELAEKIVEVLNSEDLRNALIKKYKKLYESLNPRVIAKLHYTLYKQWCKNG